jgi:protein-tyrosine phosphatase
MKKKILMVCLGNICRSPMAKGILVKKLYEKNITWVEVDSAGTSDYHIGGKADQRTMENGKKHGIDLSSHRGRQFSRRDFDVFDLIYAMDRENYSDIVYLASSEEETKKVKLILDELQPGAGLSVPDPWFGGEKDFEKVFNMLDKACDIIAGKLEFEEKA